MGGVAEPVRDRALGGQLQSAADKNKSMLPRGISQQFRAPKLENGNFGTVEQAL